MSKIKVGVFSFTCCEGCSITLLEALNSNWKKWFKHLDLDGVKMLSSKKPHKKFQFVFVEGAISTDEEVMKLKEVRLNAKNLVVIGTCAASGWPSDIRNKFDRKKNDEIRHMLRRFNYLDKVYPVSHFVKVDYVMTGCPVSQKEIEKFINKVVLNER